MNDVVLWVLSEFLASASEKQVEIEVSFVDKVWIVLRTDFSTVPNNLFNLFYILSYYRETE